MANDNQQIQPTDSSNFFDDNFVVKLLLHYRHLLRFLSERFSDEINYCLNNLKQDFNNNLEKCEQLLQDVVERNGDFKNIYETSDKCYKNHQQMMILDEQLQLTKSAKMKSFKKPKFPSPKSMVTQIRRKPEVTKYRKAIAEQKSKKLEIKNGALKRKRFDDSKKIDKRINNQTNDDLPDWDEDSDDEDIVSEENVDDHNDENRAAIELNGVVIQHICPYVGCRFKSLSLGKVKKHEKLIHSKSNVFNCPQRNCQEKFTSHHDYDNHLMQIHLIYQCSIKKCGIEFDSRTKLTRHIRSDHKKEYLTCFDCRTQYSNRDALRKHVYIRHESGHYKCSDDKCDFIATLRLDLSNHTKKMHQNKKCPYPGCERVVSNTYLPLHLRKHEQILTYLCYWPDCGKKFIDSKSLKDHVRIHVNFKRYRCKWPDCVYACEQQTNLITHIRVKHFKLPQTKKRQRELNISMDSYPNPQDYVETVPEDIFLPAFA